jgi:hypothetical protein
MHKKEFGILCLIIAVMLGLTLEVSGQSSESDMCVPMGIITIEPPEGVKATKTPVDFPHSAHFQTDCKSCHHKWNGREKIQGCMAGGCHDSTVAPETSTKYLSYSDVAIKYFKYAYHQACIGCHKEIKARNMALEKSYRVVEDKLQPAGPSGCIECHPEY